MTLKKRLFADALSINIWPLILLWENTNYLRGRKWIYDEISYQRKWGICGELKWLRGIAIIYLCADCLSHNLFRRMCSKLYQHDLYLVTSLFNDFMKPFPSKSNLTEPKSNATTWNRKKELKMAKLSGVRQCQHPKPDENNRNWWNRLKSDATVQNLTEASESGRNCPKLKSDGRARN